MRWLETVARGDLEIETPDDLVDTISARIQRGEAFRGRGATIARVRNVKTASDYRTGADRANRVRIELEGGVEIHLVIRPSHIAWEARSHILALVERHEIERIILREIVRARRESG
jgi:hypothetical protein